MDRFKRVASSSPNLSATAAPSMASRLKVMLDYAEERGPVPTREEEWLENGGDPAELAMWGDPDILAWLGVPVEADAEYGAAPRADAHALATAFPKPPAIVFSDDAATRSFLARRCSGFDCETKLIQPGLQVPRLVLTGYQAPDGRHKIVTGYGDDPAVHVKAFLAFTDAVINEHLSFLKDAQDAADTVVQAPYTGPMVYNKYRHDVPENAVNVMRPTKWGNPFTHMKRAKAPWRVASREEAVSAFEQWIVQRPELMDCIVEELGGKHLVCCCWPHACHANVLRKLANPGLEIPESPVFDFAPMRPRSMLINQNIAFDFSVIAEEAHRLDELLGLVGHPDSWFEAVMTRIFELYDMRIVEDTMLRERLIDLAQGTLGKDFASLTASGNPRRKRYTLENLSNNYLHHQLDKHSFRTFYHRYLNAHVDELPEGAKVYVMEDVEAALQVATQQQERAETNGLAKGHLIPNSVEQSSAAFSLQLVSAHGMRTALDKVQRLDAELDQWQRKLERVLKDSGLIRKEGKGKGSRDMKRIKELTKKYYEDAELEVPLTKGKDISTKGSVLEDIALIRLRRGTALEGSSEDVLVYGEEAEKLGIPSGAIDERKFLEEPLYAYSQYTSIQKIQTTYLPVLYAAAFRPVNTRFETILETGRISSFQPNLNNLPRGGIKTLLLRLQAMVRECFVPRPGFVFCSVDWNSMELVTLAQVCIWLFGYSKLADALNAGIDPHLLLAADQFLHISYEEALLRKKETAVKDMRQLAKVFNFSAPGGGGAKSLAEIAKASYNVFMTIEESKIGKAKWMAQWEMAPYFALINSLMKGGFDEYGNPVGDIISFVSGRVRGRVKYTAAANNYFQALGADCFKAALDKIVRESYLLKGRLYGARVVGCFYDETLMEHPEERAAEYAWAQRDIMVSEFEKLVPDVKIGAAPALMRCWMKTAEEAYSKSGTLIPWDPGTEAYDSKGKPIQW